MSGIFRTVFRVARMDCPSEEQIIRMRLADVAGIIRLDFDIPGRSLTVFHQDEVGPIAGRLDSLNFGTTLLESAAAEDVAPANTDGADRRLLWQVLLINGLFFAVEILTGYFSGSMGLIADSLDMLADAVVYALALAAVGGSALRKSNIARTAGVLQLLLAVGGLAEVLRRFVGTEAAPAYGTMIVVSVFALAGNALCLYLLQKSRSKEAHMQASMIFTSNDVIINLGVIVAGALVFVTKSKYPDLVIGTIVFILVVRGALQIFKLSRQ